MTFRERYNRKMSLYFLIGLALHLPVFLYLAITNGHSVLLNLSLSLAILAGPAVAFLGKSTSRLLPNLLAFSGMSYSGMLIHLGNGMIEMHFHVFIMLAIMIVFAMQTPVLTAVITIAVHHVSFYFLLPKSVFNYDASFGIVVLHATFVILEAIPVFMIATKYKYFIDLQDRTLTQLEPISKRNIRLISVVHDAGNGLSSSTSLGRNSLAQTNTSLAEMSLQVNESLGSSVSARDLAQTSRDLVQKGIGEVGSLLQTVKHISGSSDKIREIVTVIDDIAFQTNLLALNAAVEAASAGEQGRGFGVVADAVRSLAQKSAQSAKDIADLLNRNIEDIERTEKMAESSTSALMQISHSVERVYSLNTQIADSSERQQRDIQTLKTNMEDLLSMLDEVSHSASNLNSSSKELTQDANNLNALIEQIAQSENKSA